jgi:hypothetical protein
MLCGVEPPNSVAIVFSDIAPDEGIAIIYPYLNGVPVIHATKL